MIKLDDLWIGDKVRIISSDRVGVFAGVKVKRARVSVGQKIFLVTPNNLELYVEKEQPTNFFEDESRIKSIDFHHFPTTLDLHIEVLAPHLKDELPVRILSHQIKSLNDYLDKAELKKSRIFTIIHGKGRGVLKQEVMHLLKGRRSVKLIID